MGEGITAWTDGTLYRDKQLDRQTDSQFFEQKYFDILIENKYGKQVLQIVAELDRDKENRERIHQRYRKMGK